MKKLSPKLREFYKRNNLDKDEEFKLIEQWKLHRDKNALEKLIYTHMRFVKKLARGYRGYGLPIEDMISEGYLGVMQAVNSFSLEKGFRFSTYAGHCIRTALQNFILKAKSIISVKANNENKSLFFGKFQKAMESLGLSDLSSASDDDIKKIASSANISDESVRAVVPRFSTGDFSLNAPMGQEEGADTFIEMVKDESQATEEELLKERDLLTVKVLINKACERLSKNELEVIKKRRLSDKGLSLREIGAQLNISAERVRQLERSAFDKLKKVVIFELRKKKVQKR